MISKEVCQKILELCLTTGGDFAEMFIEDTITNNLELTMGKMTKANTNHLHGVAIRILKGFQEVNGYTNDFSYESLEKLALHLRSSIEGENLNIAFTLQEEKTPVITKPQRYPSSLSNQDKVSYMMKTYEAAKAYSPEVSQILCNLVDEEQTILVANTLGKMVKDFRSHIRLGATVVAGSGTNMQSASDSIGGNQGYEVLDVANLKEFGENITSSAVTMVHADEMVGGKMTVVVHNAFGGVLLHEACVHALEATTVAKGSSVFCGKLGKKVASDIVTAIDDGTRFNQWGSLNIDDEGHPTQKNILIENGILKSYLVDYRNSRVMNHPVTGSGRRQSYKLSPTSRMTNTFFAPGKDKFEDIIAKTEYGLFAKKMGGGSVNPSTGEFNFSVSEGYLIENGKITKPVRGAALVGSGAEVLMNIDMIADNLSFGHGMCGSASGSIPTDVGQPTIRVQNVTVGGRGSK
ncbi:MAG: TldD/PmbA family protein [Bacilli bacterium]|nr:TldD/PmbA family protein [Bacilli bacterium]MDD4057008.1 TldD/PmbA family protein [Bacilli bacterium]